MIHSVSSLTPVQSNNPLTYWPAAYLSVLSGQKKMAVLLEPTQIYAGGSKGCSEQPFPTSALFTALKVASYILTAFIFPALAFLVNYVVRHYNKFHYATVEVQLPAAVTNALTGFAAFQTKFLGAEKYVEDLIHGKLPGAIKQTPQQIEAALSSYTDTLIHEWTSFQSEAFRLGIALPQIGMNIQELGNRLIARKTQYVLANIDKAANQSEAEYQKALSAEKQDYAKKMQAVQELRKKIETAATKQSDPPAIETAATKQSDPPAIDRTFLTKTYPHVIDAHTFTCLNVFQVPGNKIQVVVVSALFGNALTMTLQHADIEWRTAPTAENVRNPANWKMDGIKVIFQA